MYADAEAMRAEHPLSELSCYRHPRPRSRYSRPVLAAALSILLTLGLLPWPWLNASVVLLGAWLVLTAATAALTGWLVVGAHGVGHLAAAVVVAGVLAWLIAAAFGLSGWFAAGPAAARHRDRRRRLPAQPAAALLPGGAHAA